MGNINTGRLMGLILLAQFFGGIAVNFFLTSPLTGEPGFLTNGALYAQQIGIGAILGLGVSGFMVIIAVISYPLFKSHCQVLAIVFLSMAIVGLTTSAVETMAMMSLVSYSEAFASASTATQEVMESLKGIVTSARFWAHYTNLLITGGTMFIFFSILYKFNLVPRLISGFGLLAVLSQLTTISMPFLGYDVNFYMLAPMAIVYLGLSGWLIIKGLDK